MTSRQARPSRLEGNCFIHMQEFLSRGGSLVGPPDASVCRIYLSEPAVLSRETDRETGATGGGQRTKKREEEAARKGRERLERRRRLSRRRKMRQRKGNGSEAISATRE